MAISAAIIVILSVVSFPSVYSLVSKPIYENTKTAPGVTSTEKLPWASVDALLVVPLTCTETPTKGFPASETTLPLTTLSWAHAVEANTKNARNISQYRGISFLALHGRNDKKLSFDIIMYLFSLCFLTVQPVAYHVD